jgi:hypothetical protein
MVAILLRHINEKSNAHAMVVAAWLLTNPN